MEKSYKMQQKLVDVLYLNSKNKVSSKLLSSEIQSSQEGKNEPSKQGFHKKILDIFLLIIAHFENKFWKNTIAKSILVTTNVWPLNSSSL